MSNGRGRMGHFLRKEVRTHFFPFLTHAGHRNTLPLPPIGGKSLFSSKDPFFLGRTMTLGDNGHFETHTHTSVFRLYIPIHRGVRREGRIDIRKREEITIRKVGYLSNYLDI
ncbi:hypothetical protein NPIL_71331 [Nephila pilipes]|uniref:Uncharacterized protein n=1 Tax=Nephila pilipes TaxID=299642 RepID=A0A8X6TLQ2_NEPPI|nr:hypothetical protein NPIL_71331 [Nephila pilipes]